MSVSGGGVGGLCMCVKYKSASFQFKITCSHECLYNICTWHSLAPLVVHGVVVPYSDVCLSVYVAQQH